MRTQLLDTPVKTGRKSFLLALQKQKALKLANECKKKEKSKITDFFKTQKVRCEEPIGVKLITLFDGVNENSLTVDQSESTFDGYNASISLCDLEKTYHRRHQFELNHVKVFDTMSLVSNSSTSNRDTQDTAASLH